MARQRGDRDSCATERLSCFAWQAGSYGSAMLRIALLLVCCTLSTIPLHLTGAEQGRYFFNPRINSRDIALNEMIRLTFSTMPIQVPGVDVEQSVLRSLQAGKGSRDWRLLNPPLITIHEKGNDVEIFLNFCRVAVASYRYQPLTCLA